MGIYNRFCNRRVIYSGCRQEKTERYLWAPGDIASGFRTLTLESAGVNQANIQYMWVPEGKGEGEQANVSVTVDFLPVEWRAELGQQGMEITDDTTITLFGKNALSINSGVHLVAGIADGSLTKIPGITLTDGKMTVQWPDGYPIKPENIFQGYTAICVKIVTGTKEAYYGFTGWSGGSATAAEGMMLTPNPVYNHLYVLDRETIYDAEIRFQSVVTTASSASSEQFSAAKSKIHSDAVLLEDIKEVGGTYMVPSPVTDDMAENDQQPYLYLRAEDGTPLAKWVCVGFRYLTYELDGVNQISRSVEVPVTDWGESSAEARTIPVPGGSLYYTYPAIAVTYLWELDGNQVSYDLNVAEGSSPAEGELPKTAKIYMYSVNEAGVEAFTSETVNPDQMKTQTVIEGGNFTVRPERANTVDDGDVTGYIAVATDSDGVETYYLLDRFTCGVAEYRWGDTAVMGGTDMTLVAQWREVDVAEYAVNSEDPDFPQFALATLGNSAVVSQKKTGGNSWTTDSSNAPLVLENDGLVYYRAKLSMLPLIAKELADKRIADPEFAAFDIHVELDETLELVAENDQVTFTFTTGFLRPVAGKTTGTALIRVSGEEIPVPVEEVVKSNPFATTYTYTYTVPVEQLAKDFDILMEWRPTATGYESLELESEMVLSTLTAKLADTDKVVGTGGHITGKIDFAHAKDENGNLVITSYTMRMIAMISFNDAVKAYCDDNNSGTIEILEFLKLIEWAKAALNNLDMGGNTVYAKLPSYTVTVNYLDEAGNAIHEPYKTEPMVVGSVYDVTEQDKIAIDNYIYTRTEGSLTGTLDEDKVVNVYYTRGEGALAISKTVNGVDTDRQFTFIITLMDGETPLTGTYAYTGSKEGSITLDENGSAQIQLSNGQHIAINKIPAGVRYVVTETPVEDFSTQVTGHDATAAGNVDNGSIVSGASATVTYINTYDPEPVPQYTITVNYRDVNTAQALINSVIVTLNEGDPYDVSGLIYGSIGQYAYVRTTGGPVAGTITANIEITAWYQSTYVPPYIPPVNPPVDPGTDIDDENVPLADLPGLNTVDHYAYIAGYPDGTVRPNGNITRAEVATIFFRLFTDEYRQTYWATSNPFSDVAFAAWYNNGVSTTANAGIVAGYPDGTFLPDNNITRAEFATIAARFLSEAYAGPDLFTDISGHWAQEYINRAANAGWINGYPDGTFHPDAYITRAEAVTLVNNMLGRMPHEDHLLANMKVWPDNPETAWYYEAVQEATNSHDYDWATEEEVRLYEIWTELLPERDWAALETEWANAYSAPGGQVMGN